MKIIALTAAAALTLGSAAHAYQDEPDDDRLIPLGTSANTQTYDGPNSEGAPGQPAPEAGSSQLTASFATYSATQRTEYAFCSETVRDNCRQRRDPGY